MLKVRTLSKPVIQHLVNANCKPHLLYGSEVIGWNNSELSNIVYAFDSAMCRIYNVNLKLLPTHCLPLHWADRHS